MGVENKVDHTEDEDDLEALRLAALNSLKKKNGSSESLPKQDFPVLPHNNYKNAFRGGKRRFFPGSSGRGNRNGQYNSSRNPNLISIPTSAPDSDEVDARTKKFASKDNEPPKLILPQDRYANKTTQGSENDGQSSKFDRYNNSNSESEEDDEIPDAKLERCDSLEALMEELDAEIMGESLTDRKAKVKKDSKLEEKKSEIIKEDEISVDSNEQEAINVEIIKHEKSPLKDIPESSQEKSENVVKDDVKVARNFVNKPNFPKSPTQKKNQHRRLKNGRVFKPLPPVIIPNQPFMNVLPAPQFTAVYNTVPSYSIHEPYPLNVPPPFIQPQMVPLDVPPVGFNVPPLQPLVIQDPVPMGPLSPRSAAFVLQNRAIVEKRKRSPRRSFSRSPSPPSRRARYSKSPGRSRSPTRRSLSPVRRPFSPRTTSPRRSPVRRSLSPYRRNRDKSPRRESPRRSPRRQRNSPKSTRESPKRIKESRRTPIKDRLGNKSKNEDKEIAAKEVSSTSSKKSDPKPLDPVLEARKKKFESKEINVKERVIRLKPKEDSATKNNEAKPQNAEIDKKSKVVDEIKPKQVLEKPISVPKEENNRIVLLPKNETKIKSQTPTPEEPQTDQLEDAINELEMLLKDDEALELSAKVDDLFTDDELEENESKKAKSTEDRLVMNGTSKQSSEKKKDSKNKWKFEETKKELTKSKKTKKEPLTNPIENRKIEIKIRNPSKYEKNGNSASQGSLQSSNVRTVELAKKDTFSEEDSEPEIIEEEEEEIEVTANREGDLRAQLSRKRAERQNKLPCLEGVQSRLLQSALEGAVFKTKKSKRKDKEPKDVKLPIHLRLGIAHDSDIFTESVLSEKTSRKKSKKRKYADMEQVLLLMRI